MQKSKLQDLHLMLSDEQFILSDDKSKQLEQILTKELAKIDFENDSDESAANLMLNGKDTLTKSQLKWLASLLIRTDNYFCPELTTKTQ